MNSLNTFEPNHSANLNILTGDMAHLLQFIQENYNINMDDVRDNMNKKEQEKLLSKHKYAITQGKDGRWKTTIPDATKKSGRKLIAKTVLKDLEKVLIDFYKEEEIKVSVEDMTLRSFLPEWLKYKSLHVSGQTINRIKADWNRYYENDSIVDTPLCKLDFLTLDTWAHKLVKDNKLSKKGYYNATIIVRQEMEYISIKHPEFMPVSPFARVRVNGKMFHKEAQPEDRTQVFGEEEEKLICEKAMEKSLKRPKSVTGLAVLLSFQLGVRVGELVALRWGDIILVEDDYYIHVQRTESVGFYVNEAGEVIREGVMVAEHTKTDAGNRILYLTEKAREILRMVKERNDKYNLHDEDYIFVNSFSQRLREGKVNSYLHSLCDEIDISRRSSHKIRKTYISTLYDHGISFNEVRRIAGHEDERTGLKSYCFNRKTSKETAKTLETISKCKQV